MFCTAEIDETVIGNTLARKIRKTGAASDTPNHRIATGIQAMGEMGRKIWIIGLNASKALRYQPSARPAGTPTSTASPKPHVTRNKRGHDVLEEQTLAGSVRRCRAPLRRGVGNRSLPEKRTATCQHEQEHAGHHQRTQRTGRSRGRRRRRWQRGARNAPRGLLNGLSGECDHFFSSQWYA